MVSVTQRTARTARHVQKIVPAKPTNNVQKVSVKISDVAMESVSSTPARTASHVRLIVPATHHKSVFKMLASTDAICVLKVLFDAAMLTAKIAAKSASQAVAVNLQHHLPLRPSFFYSSLSYLHDAQDVMTKNTYSLCTSSQSHRLVHTHHSANDRHVCRHIRPHKGPEDEKDKQTHTFHLRTHPSQSRCYHTHHNVACCVSNQHTNHRSYRIHLHIHSSPPYKSVHSDSVFHTHHSETMTSSCPHSFSCNPVYRQCRKL